MFHSYNIQATYYMMILTTHTNDIVGLFGRTVHFGLKAWNLAHI